MAYINYKYHSVFTNNNGDTVRLELYPKDYTGSSTAMLLQDVSIEGEIEDQEDIFSPFRKSFAELVVIQETQDQYIEFFEFEWDSYWVKILYNGVQYWTGFVLPDEYYGEENTFPNKITLKCIDGLKALKMLSFYDAMGEQLGTSSSYRVSMAYIVRLLLTRIQGNNKINLAINYTSFPQNYSGELPEVTLLGGGLQWLNDSYYLIFQSDYYTKKKSCYDFLKDFCYSFGLTMFCRKGDYYIASFPMLWDDSYVYKDMPLAWYSYGALVDQLTQTSIERFKKSVTTDTASFDISNQVFLINDSLKLSRHSGYNVFAGTYKSKDSDTTESVKYLRIRNGATAGNIEKNVSFFFNNTPQSWGTLALKLKYPYLPSYGDTFYNYIATRQFKPWVQLNSWAFFTAWATTTVFAPEESNSYPEVANMFYKDQYNSPLKLYEGEYYGLMDMSTTIIFQDGRRFLNRRIRQSLQTLQGSFECMEFKMPSVHALNTAVNGDYNNDYSNDYLT